MTTLIVDANSLVDKFGRVVPRSLVDTLILRLTYKVKMLHFPERTVVINSGRTLPFNNVHKTTLDTYTTLQQYGVDKDTIILSADPLLLGLTFYKIKCYEPSDNWLEPTEITHGRLKKRLGYDPRDHGLVTADMDKKEKAAVGRERKQRWAWAEQPGSMAYISIAENVHVKVGRTDFQNYEVVQDVPTFAAMLEKVDDLGWDTETDGLDWQRNHIVGESFSFDGRHGYYMPMRHDVEGRQYHNVSAQQVEDIIHPLLNKRKLRGANLQFDVLMGAEHGLDFPDQLYDVQGYGYMLGLHVPDPSKLGLKSLSHEQLNEVMQEYSAVAKGDTFNNVPIDRAAPYAADDAVKSYRLIDHMGAQLTTEQHERYTQIYMPLLYTCNRMAYNGLYVDLDELDPLLDTLKFEMEMAQSHVNAMAGHEVNINSPMQLQKLLFEELALPPTPLTKSGRPSTAAQHIEYLKDEHPIIEEIILWKQLGKLVGTYLEAWPEMIGTDGRLHSSINPFKAITGRLSSSNPNLMNIPVRSEVGRKIRMLVAGQGQDMLLSADAGQLEYRILAHFTGNPEMIATFCDPSRDIHRTTASLIFSKPEQEITGHERDVAKTAFYAILYGATAQRVARTLGISISEAQGILSRIRTGIPELDELKRDVVDSAKQLGYVESLLGHRSHVYGLFASNRGTREAAERTAFDSLFQGTGSGDVTAIATIETQRLLDTYYPPNIYGYKPLVRLDMQVHDELILEGPEDALEIFGPMVSKTFENSVQLSVPIVADYKIGKKWGEIH